MARIIRQENLNKEEIAELNSEENKIIPTEETQTISAEELEKLLFQWNQNEKCHLTIDYTLKEKIEAYLENQKELELLKRQMVEEKYKRYVVSSWNIEQSGKCSNIKIFFGSTYLVKACVYRGNHIRDYSYVSCPVAKLLLRKCGEIDASYLNIDSDYFNIRQWIYDNYGHIEKGFKKLNIII